LGINLLAGALFWVQVRHEKLEHIITHRRIFVLAVVGDRGGDK
jgi:hypothetical protein